MRNAMPSLINFLNKPPSPHTPQLYAELYALHTN